MLPVWNRWLGVRFFGLRADLWFAAVFTVATALIFAATRSASHQSPVELESAHLPIMETDAPSAAESELSEAESRLVSESVQGMRRHKLLPLYVYKDAGVASYYPDGWMGDYRDIKLDPYCNQLPESGKTCFKVTYAPGASLNCKWAGVYWMFPGNSWGTRKGGYDLSGAKKLTFWARGDKGGEVIQEFKVGGIAGKFRDSDTAGIGPVELTADWKKYEIDLDGVDLSYISGGFCWATNLDQNKEGCVFYLDEIVYE